MTIENRISDLILQTAFHVHRTLGPGLVRSAYLQCLTYEIRQLGLEVDSHKEMPLVYGDLKINIGYTVDMMVEKRVLIQVKHGENISDLDMAKMKTYLKLSGCKMGFLINFNVRTLNSGIRRVISHPQSYTDEMKTAI